MWADSPTEERQRRKGDEEGRQLHFFLHLNESWIQLYLQIRIYGGDTIRRMVACWTMNDRDMGQEKEDFRISKYSALYM